MLKTIRKHGITLALFAAGSTGLTAAINQMTKTTIAEQASLQQKALFDQVLRLTAVVANELEIMDGKFTGNVIGDIVDAQYKAKTLTRLAQEYEIPLAQTVAIGDGANDLPMIKAAGLGIAYHAKPKVNEKTEVTIRHADLMGVFCILSGSLNQK